jgi:hypothetical protein
MSKPADFNPQTVVKLYRELTNERDGATTRKLRLECDRAMRGLKRFWKEWQGEDSLHEMAFGEPDE